MPVPSFCCVPISLAACPSHEFFYCLISLVSAPVLVFCGLSLLWCMLCHSLTTFAPPLSETTAVLLMLPPFLCFPPPLSFSPSLFFFFSDVCRIASLPLLPPLAELRGCLPISVLSKPWVFSGLSHCTGSHVPWVLQTDTARSRGGAG